MLIRIYRPCAFEPFKCQDRVELLLNHCRTLEVTGWSKRINESVTQAVVLGEVTSKSGDLVVLTLLFLGEKHREGEMSLLLQWQGRVIFTVSFLLASSDHGFNMIITRLHDNRDHDGKEVIRQATQTVNGLLIEMGAVKKQSGFFHLHPRVHLPSDFSDVASHKRAEAKRKATILSCLLLSMDNTVGAYRDEATTFSLESSA